MSMTGLSFVVGNEEIIKKSKDYPKRSYYCNLYLQYEYFENGSDAFYTTGTDGICYPTGIKRVFC